MISDIQMLIQIPHELAQNWGWFLALGIGLAILGLAAVVRFLRNQEMGGCDRSHPPFPEAY